MLALVRSEIAIDILDKASAVLFADGARILCELIRIVMAVESEPADKYYAAAGIDPRKIPAGVTMPVRTVLGEADRVASQDRHWGAGTRYPGRCFAVFQLVYRLGRQRSMDTAHSGVVLLLAQSD